MRTRLLFSYVLVLVLTLAVIGVALLLLLQVGPKLTEPISLNLYKYLQRLDIAEDQQTIAAIPTTGPTVLQRALFNRLDKQYKVRILLADSDGVLSYDSRKLDNEGTQLNLETEPYSPDGIPSNEQISTVRGVLHDPDSNNWMFVAQAAEPDKPDAQLIYVAVKQPADLTVQETLQYYGSDILIPVAQAGLIGLAVAVIMSLIIARWIARPLQELAKAAAAVARGDVDQRVPERGPREVRTVAQAFNQMAQEVGETQQAQRDFLANVTHDLRTPLTSIQGFSQAIIDGVASNPNAAQRAARIIYDEAGRLNRMVQELLDLARIEAGRLNMTRQSVSLEDILRSVGENLTPRAADKGLTLVVDVPSLPMIAGDGDRLTQVYTNLVDNAIKHTPSGGTVTVRAALHENGILAQIADTGEGIPADDLPHVFDRFYQVDKSRQSENRDGVGLGLAITKGIIDAHGGKLWVESKEGVGTTFSTWFPALAPDSQTLVSHRRAGLFKTPPSKSSVDRKRVSTPDGS